MPNYKAHLVGGAVAYFCGLYMLKSYQPTAPMAIEWLACSLAGSLFPDIDTKSKGQKLFYFIIFFCMLYCFLGSRCEAFIILSVISLVPLLVNHRGMFHRLWFVVAVPLGGAAMLGTVFPAYATAILWDSFFFVLGAVSHLWLDLGVRRMLRF